VNKPGVTVTREGDNLRIKADKNVKLNTTPGYDSGLHRLAMWDNLYEEGILMPLNADGIKALEIAGQKKEANINEALRKKEGELVAIRNQHKVYLGNDKERKQYNADLEAAFGIGTEPKDLDAVGLDKVQRLMEMIEGGNYVEVNDASGKVTNTKNMSAAKMTEKLASGEWQVSFDGSVSVEKGRFYTGGEHEYVQGHNYAGGHNSDFIVLNLSKKGDATTDRGTTMKVKVPLDSVSGITSLDNRINKMEGARFFDTMRTIAKSHPSNKVHPFKNVVIPAFYIDELKDVTVEGVSGEDSKEFALNLEDIMMYFPDKGSKYLDDGTPNWDYIEFKNGNRLSNVDGSGQDFHKWLTAAHKYLKTNYNYNIYE
jgi:hypothetical protein